MRTSLRLLALLIALGGTCLFGLSQAHLDPKAPPPPDARVDINSASMEELLKVPGLARTWAARIVHFRPYRMKNDLLDKGIVSDQVYDRIKDYIIAHRNRE